jgi:hypothetical protein
MVSSSGVYVVKEDGLQFQHNTHPPGPDDGPCTPDEFLVRFR